MAWSKMADMEMDDEAQLEAVMPIAMPDKPRFPYGLRICLTHDELKKLNLKPDCEVGDVIDLRAFATVTSVSISQSEGGDHCRVELQIEKLAIENESGEGPGDGDDK